MSNGKSKKNKHLTLDERLEIQECLNRKMTFKAIGALLSKDQTTISKEVKKHIDARDEGIRRTGADGNPATAEICPTLLKAPFVCNPCGKRHARCKFRKQFYHAKLAQKEYETVLSESREGIPLNKESFYEADRIISTGIKEGQHLYHIMQTNNVGISKSTAYRHLRKGYLSASSLDFPRVVKFKARKSKREGYVPKATRIGRSHDDFLAYVEENSIRSWAEIDTVIGRIGGKVIMTIDFTFCNFMVGLLLDNKTSLEVTKKVEDLKRKLKKEGIRFGDIMPLALTDNGGEFANVAAMENDADGKRETLLYFCDPYQSSQKPHVEKNHTMFRDIVPKGESFDSFTQQTINMIFSHMNGVKRKSLGGKSPYEMFVFAYGETVATVLGIEHIPPERVAQSPKLLKKPR
jgi:IS30 family transposase